MQGDVLPAEVGNVGSLLEGRSQFTTVSYGLQWPSIQCLSHVAECCVVYVGRFILISWKVMCSERNLQNHVPYDIFCWYIPGRVTFALHTAALHSPRRRYSSRTRYTGLPHPMLPCCIVSESFHLLAGNNNNGERMCKTDMVGLDADVFITSLPPSLDNVRVFTTRIDQSLNLTPDLRLCPNTCGDDLRLSNLYTFKKKCIFYPLSSALRFSDSQISFLRLRTSLFR